MLEWSSRMLRCLTPHCSSLPPTQRHQMDREAVVFLIDASPAMLQRAPGVTTNAVNTGDGESSKSQVQIKTYLDVAIDCARGLLRDRVVAAPSDKQGVVFFNTKHTRGLVRQGPCFRVAPDGRAERAANPRSFRPTRRQRRDAISRKDWRD